MSLCNLIYNPVCVCVFRVPTAAEVEKWKKSFSHVMNSESKCYISVSHIKKKKFNPNQNKASNLMFESKDSGTNKPSGGWHLQADALLISFPAESLSGFMKRIFKSKHH